MRKNRKIIVKDGKLQNIRNNLRSLLLEWLNSVLNELFNDYKITRSRNSLQRMESLDLMSRKSICKCIACGNSKKDMHYNSILHEWYCVECFIINREFYEKRMSGEGCLYDDFNEDYYKTFL